MHSHANIFCEWKDHSGKGSYSRIDPIISRFGKKIDTIQTHGYISRSLHVLDICNMLLIGLNELLIMSHRNACDSPMPA